MIDFLTSPDTNEEYLRASLIDFGFAKKFKDLSQPENHIIES